MIPSSRSTATAVVWHLIQIDDAQPVLRAREVILVVGREVAQVQELKGAERQQITEASAVLGLVDRARGCALT